MEQLPAISLSQVLLWYCNLREAAKKSFLSGLATKRGKDFFLNLIFDPPKKVLMRVGGKALVAGPLKRYFFAASLIKQFFLLHKTHVLLDINLG